MIEPERTDTNDEPPAEDNSERPGTPISDGILFFQSSFP
jgi:hypothetical protein